MPATGVEIKDIDFEMLQNIDVIERAALILRKQILAMEPQKLPSKIKTKHLIDEECPQMPKNLIDFYRTLLCGNRARSKESNVCNRLVQSFSEDVIYAITNGRIKTAKHITLGIAIKSLTNSRKLLDILNRFGHSCSYTIVEELETEATFSSNEGTQVCPDDIMRKPNLNTGLAFNNFDRYVETLTGKNTLHDTVGIIFLNIQEEENLKMRISASMNRH